MIHPTVELPLTLYFVSARLRLTLGNALNEHCGISFDDFALLHLLSETGGSSLQELSTQLSISRASLLQRSRPLEKVGLISSEGDLANRQILLSKAGARTLLSACQSIEEVGSDLFASTDLANSLLKAIHTERK